MFSFILRVLLYALTFVFIVPHLSGAAFHGGFWPVGLLFGLMFAGGIAIFEAIFAIGYVIIAYLLGELGRALACLSYWLVPTIVLLLQAHFYPQFLSLGHGAAGIIACLIFSGIWALLE